MNRAPFTQYYTTITLLNGHCAPQCVLSSVVRLLRSPPLPHVLWLRWRNSKITSYTTHTHRRHIYTQRFKWGGICCLPHSLRSSFATSFLIHCRKLKKKKKKKFLQKQNSAFSLSVRGARNVMDFHFSSFLYTFLSFIRFIFCIQFLFSFLLI